MDEPRVLFIEIPVPKPRSISPLSPSPFRERHGGVFDLISRRFGRRSHDELCFQNHGEEDSRSSSTDSCSSTSGRLTATSKNNIQNSNLELNCSTSDSSSNDSNDNATTESQQATDRDRLLLLHQTTLKYSVSNNQRRIHSRAFGELLRSSSKR